MKNLFGRKQKVLVDVGGKKEPMTATQSYRFSEIQEARSPTEQETGDIRGTPEQGGYHNPLEQSRYTLEEAAFRLMISGDEIIQRAAKGGLRLYVDVGGVEGRWCRREPSGRVSQSSPGTIVSGLLRLRSKSCKQLAASGHASVATLDLCTKADPVAAGIDHDTMANLIAWGKGDKQFFPTEPLFVDRSTVVLLPPLS